MMPNSYAPETNEAIITELSIRKLRYCNNIEIMHKLYNAVNTDNTEMASRQTDVVAKLLNEDGLACLLNGEDAEATQSFIEDFLCGENPRDSGNGNISNCSSFAE